MRNVLRIFNIILIAISAVAIGFVALTPLMKMNVDYTVQTTDLENVFKGKLGSGEDSISDEELHDIIVKGTGGDGIKFSLELKLESKGMKKMRDATNDDRVQALYDEVFKPVIQQVIDNEEIKGVINELARTMAKKMAKKTIREQIFDHVVGTGEKTNEFLENAGITDEFLDNQVDTIYDALTGENASVDSVTDAILDVLKDTSHAFQDAVGDDYSSYNEGGENYLSDADIEEKRGEIKDTLEAALKENNLADEDGNILSVDEALAMIIEQMMNQATNSSSSSSSSGEESPSIVLAHYADSSAEEEAKTEENKKTLSDVVSEAAWKVINDNVFKDDATKNTIGEVLGMVSKYGVIVQYVFMGMWGLLAIFALIKIFSKKKPYVYMGFFWWFAIVLFGIIELVFGALLFIKPILTALKSTVAIPEAIAGLEFSLYSNLSVVWICNTVLFFFSIAYAVIGHKVKRDYKMDKRARKAAQAA